MRPEFDWGAIRIDYESGMNQTELSKKYHVSRKAIQKHINSEGWMQDVSQSINILAEAKVAGVVAGCDSKKIAAALDAAAARKAEVINRHREAWEDLNSLHKRAVAEEDFQLAKLAKISAETQAIIQMGERRAWGISDKADSVQTSVEIKWNAPC